MCEITKARQVGYPWHNPTMINKMDNLNNISKHNVLTDNSQKYAQILSKEKYFQKKVLAFMNNFMKYKSYDKPDLLS